MYAEQALEVSGESSATPTSPAPVAARDELTVRAESWARGARAASFDVPAWRGIDRYGRRPRVGGLHRNSIVEIIKRRAAAAELEVPQLWGGHSLRRGFAAEAIAAGVPERDVQRHGRWRSRASMGPWSVPWQDEAIAVATHKPNVHLDLSGWSPKYSPPQLVRAANTMLQDEVLFGSDHPLLSPERWMTAFDRLEIKPEVRPKILEDNAVRVLGLDS